MGGEGFQCAFLEWVLLLEACDVGEGELRGRVLGGDGIVEGAGEVVNGLVGGRR